MSSSTQLTAGDLADLLAESGATVAGGMALGAAVGFIAASIARDLGVPLSVREWTDRFMGLGAVAGSRRLPTEPWE